MEEDNNMNDYNLLISIDEKHTDKFYIETEKDVDMFGWETRSKHQSYYMHISPWNLVDLVENKDKLGISIKYDDRVLSIIEALRNELRSIKKAHRFKVMPQDELEACWEDAGFYDLFPKSTELFTVDPYQKRMILWLLEVKKGGCYLEQGLGKTLAGTMFLGKLFYDGLIKRPLVIAPLSLLSDTQWFSELEKFSDLKPINLRNDDLTQTGDIYFINPEKLNHWCYRQTANADKSYFKDNFFEMMKFDGIFVDESAVFKSHNSYRSKSILELNKYIKYLALASGVPSPNNIFQIFVQMQLLNFALGDSYTAFEQRYGILRNVGPTKKYFPNAQAESQIRKRIDNVTYFIMRENVIKLPPRHEETIEVELSEDHRKLYEQIKKDYVAAIKGFDEDGNKLEGKAVIQHEVAVRIKLLQILNGFITLTDDFGKKYRVTLPWNAKLDALDIKVKKVLEDPEKNIIIWCRFRWEIETIYKIYKEHSVFLYGGMTDAKREENLVKWKNDPTCRIMIAHPKTARYGFTWLKATETIFFSGTEDYEDFAQCRDRNYRRGQTREVTETRIIAKNTIERLVWAAIRTKKKLDRYLKAYFIGPE